MRKGVTPGVVGAIISGAAVYFSGTYEKSIWLIIGVSVLVGLVVGSIYYLTARRLRTAKPK